jgi:hypothetical protein
VTSQGLEPLDRNDWRVVRIPGPKEVLELLGRPGGGRADAAGIHHPHVVEALDAAATSDPAADQRRDHHPVGQLASC